MTFIIGLFFLPSLSFIYFLLLAMKNKNLEQEDETFHGGGSLNFFPVLENEMFFSFYMTPHDQKNV